MTNVLPASYDVWRTTPPDEIEELTDAEIEKRDYMLELRQRAREDW